MQVTKPLCLTMTQPKRSPCPVSCTLDLIGDRWTLLVIRDMMFFGKQRFEEFLESPEGISTNILANRLKLLEELGLAEKQPYSNHSRRMNYQLTEKGKSLRPVLKAITVWGLKHIDNTQIPRNHLTDADRPADNLKATEP
jgi:DNA-binding HxlR family transcriptional regulator